MLHRRISILVGHFGSGKSEVAINYALRLAAVGTAVSLVDLDVIKPYFRSRSAKAWLEAAGVDLVAPGGENFYADLPIIIPRVRALCVGPGIDSGRRIIMDVGGDDNGARVLGSLSDVLNPDEADVVAVVNFRRPLTPDPESAVNMIRAIEGKARLRVSAVVSNTHVMEHTTTEDVRDGFEMASETALAVGAKVIGVCVPAVLNGRFDEGEFGCEVFPVNRVLRTVFAPDSAESDGGDGSPTGGNDAIPGRYGVRRVGPLFLPDVGPDNGV